MDNNLTHNIDKLYFKIKEILSKARSKVYQNINFEMVKAYWNIGKEIILEEQQGKERAGYGQFIIKDLSQKMTEDYGKGFDKSNLWHMRKFYLTYPILDAVSRELSWTHYRILIRVEKEQARGYYMQEAIACNWSTRQLERQINSLYYERILMSGKQNRPAVKQEAENNKEEMNQGHIIKDPYVLEFLELGQDKKYLEKELEQALIDKLQYFILELGKGFAFVSRQYRITADTKHYYIDLVFYNYILKCFLLIDLKTGELTHQDIGQMDFYVRYFEGNKRQGDDNPSIGLILCTEKNKTIVKYSLLNESKQIFASKYQLYLPTEKQLMLELEREREIIEQEKNFKDEKFND